MDKSIDIEKNDCYKNPTYKKDTKEVVEANKTMNKYVQETITYDLMIVLKNLRERKSANGCMKQINTRLKFTVRWPQNISKNLLINTILLE